MRFYQYYKLSIVGGIILLLAGCFSPQFAKISSSLETASSNQYKPALSDFHRCQSEVSALAVYDGTRYQQQNTALNDLMDRGAKYLLTRPQLTPEMQATLDSVYQAEMAKRCQSIHSELFNAMLMQIDGE